MKHVFSVHSPITFLVAYATIKHLGLKREDVLILSSTYKVLIDDYKVIPSFSETRNNTLFQKLKYFNVPKSHDQYLDLYLNGQGFIAYIDLMSYAQKVLVTHQQCKAFHFIEEGNSAYMAWDNDKDLTWEDYTGGMLYRVNFVERNYIKSLIRTLRGYNLRLISLPYHYMAYANFKGINFFAFSNNAFYNVSPDKRVLVKSPANDTNIQKLAGGHFLNDSTIWLDGSNARYTGLEESYYYDAIKKAIPLLKEKGIIKDKVYAKLRPGIKDFSTNKLVSILKANNIEVEVMPNDMIIEAFLIQSENCKIIGVMTSVLEYAHVFGHEAYSIYGLFEKQPPTFFDRMTGFWQNIESLKA
jgi:hypothetical protein